MTKKLICPNKRCAAVILCPRISYQGDYSELTPGEGLSCECPKCGWDLQNDRAWDLILENGSVEEGTVE